MDFVGGGGGGGSGGLGSENGPILYSEPNRTSAIDDIRSVVIYIFIITIFLCFFLILPGIRNEKFPTFLCITTSLIVTSIILIALFGTTWHVGEAPISAAYKAFSRDRIQGELSVRIGLQSVNITLRAQKYYILHATDGPIIMDNSPIMGLPPSEAHLPSSSERPSGRESANSLAEELIGGRTSDGLTVDTELEVEEVFGSDARQAGQPALRTARSFSNSTAASNNNSGQIQKRSAELTPPPRARQRSSEAQKYTIERVNVDINYNERFYWIGPNQMRQEHQNALERGLPYPILTVVEYLSQDEAGFSWSRQYRLAGYYSYITLWLALCVCALMFFLHCAAPKYGIYTMQILGGLLLFTNFTYATLVPRGEQKLVIPFEGQSLSFKFGWNFWLVLIGGCLSLFVGTLIVLIDLLFPNFIFTTILDVDFDSHISYYRNQRRQKSANGDSLVGPGQLERPAKPPFFDGSTGATTNTTSSTLKTLALSSQSSRTSLSLQRLESAQPAERKRSDEGRQYTVHSRQRAAKQGSEKASMTHLSELFVKPTFERATGGALSSQTSDSETGRAQEESVVEILTDEAGDTYGRQARDQNRHHYGKSQENKNSNLKTTDHQSRREESRHAAEQNQVRL